MSRRAQPYRKKLGTRPPGQALDNMMRGTALGDAMKASGPSVPGKPDFAAMLVAAAKKKKRRPARPGARAARPPRM